MGISWDIEATNIIICNTYASQGIPNDDGTTIPHISCFDHGIYGVYVATMGIVSRNDG